MTGFDSYTFHDYSDKIYTIDELRNAITPILEQSKIEQAWIFGSYAKGAARPDSDLDLAVRVCEGERLSEYLLLYDPITEALKKSVDIFDIREFKSSGFMTEAIKIYDRGTEND